MAATEGRPTVETANKWQDDRAARERGLALGQSPFAWRAGQLEHTPGEIG